VLGGFIVTAVPGESGEPYAGAAAGLAGRRMNIPRPTKHPRVVVLGIDGMDPDILADVIELYPDLVPNLKRLVDEGDGIHALGTSTPPQSPVAWSNFITGLNPGGHGIFDFIHRNPNTKAPASSTAKEGEEATTLPLGGYRIPLPFTGSGGSNRTGEPFWVTLRKHGVPADIWRMPINFPVEASKGWSFPGMMTPALDSAYGECSFWTTSGDRAIEVQYKKLEQVREFSGVIDMSLKGPINSYKHRTDAAGQPVPKSVPMKAYVDRDSGAAALVVGDSRLVLRPGQWSAFVRVEFPMLPMGLESVHGIVRFYLRSIEPFELYCSPVNADPTNPPSPVSQPADASAKLADAIGLYYTQGMAEDVGALKRGVLSDEEFMAQSNLVFTERRRMLDYALERYMAKDDGGLLFFYFSTIDLTSHMMWRLTDRAHPGFDPELAARDSSWWSGRAGSTWFDTVHDLYIRMDEAVGEIRAAVGDDTTFVLMSDHGFAPFRRKFGLNRWLVDEGYLVLREGVELPTSTDDHLTIFGVRRDRDAQGNEIGEPYTVVDWAKTRAYGMGFNGLYLNRVGREGDNPLTPAVEAGIVAPGAQADALAAEIKAKLEAIQDPETGMRPVLRCDAAAAVYSGRRVAEAPELLVGFNAGYGNSDPASTGEITSYVLADNASGSFNGSHLMAPDVVAGLLVSNEPVRAGEHALEDLTVEVLERFGVAPLEDQKGHRVLATGP
jgi:predicted AlkP superfamily phosphohydrolase/phosphomutase